MDPILSQLGFVNVTPLHKFQPAENEIDVAYICASHIVGMLKEYWLDNLKTHNPLKLVLAYKVKKQNHNRLALKEKYLIRTQEKH